MGLTSRNCARACAPDLNNSFERHLVYEDCQQSAAGMETGFVAGVSYSRRDADLRRAGAGGEILGGARDESHHFDPDRECLVVLLLNTRRKIKGHHLVSIGTIDTILVSASSVFRLAILAAAS